MSDDADRAQWRIEKDLQLAMEHARSAPGMRGHGCCHFCEEPVTDDALFCDRDCRDDFEREEAARLRAGIRFK